MKIKKNNIVFTLTESDIKSIKKHLLKEDKVSFKSCFVNYPEWLRPDSTVSGDAGSVASVSDKGLELLMKKIKTGVTFSLGNCETLKNDEINAGILSKITDSSLREKALEKTVNFCRGHIEDVVKDLKNGDKKFIAKRHIKQDFKPETGESIEEWVNKHDFNEDIQNLTQVSKCLYSTYF